MPSWDHHSPKDVLRETEQARRFDPDAVEVPESYSADEWAETEGSLEDRLNHSTHFERVQDAGYEPGDPKGYSVL
jgi:hypothetical protein